MFCIAPLIWSTICCMSCWRSLSISCSKRCARLGRREVVGAAAPAPCRPGRRAACRAGSCGPSPCCGRPRRGARRRCSRPRVVAFSMRVALFVDDVAQLVGDLVVHAAEVEPIEPVLALLAQLVHQLAQALQALAVAVGHALLHHPAQRAVDVAVVQQVVGDLVEERIGVEVEALLRAIPARVREPSCHGSNLVLYALQSSCGHADVISVSDDQRQFDR